ncbi:MAG: gamma-glutamylcyclotransferase family protein [Azospirillaceae bacterium]
MRLFFFGSLLDPDLFELVIGRPIERFDHAPAVIDGWARHKAIGEDYPILVPRPDGRVPGRLLDGFTAREIDRCHFFEGADYEAAPLTVRVVATERFAPGAYEAHAYFSTGSLADAGEPWTLTDWRAREKPLAMVQAEAFMALYDTHTGAEADDRWEEVKAWAQARFEREAADQPIA